MHLLLGQPLLDLLVVAHAVGDGPRQFGLDAAQPGAEVTHVLVQLLHRHQGLLELLHPASRSVQKKEEVLQTDEQLVSFLFISIHTFKLHLFELD